ncbi:serine/threonine-protein kinase WNK-like [Sycon ciliatum]|uniref:serine/threonine-protein kinase WNK-like n=1 Tax=Sycon ciliatum TaxID=27933 RepID=UPI0031F697EC
MAISTPEAALLLNLGLRRGQIAYHGIFTVRVEDEIGRGSDADVYRVVWQGIPVAAKVLHPRHDPTDAEGRDRNLRRFGAEIARLSQLHHPNLCQILGVGVTADRYLPVLVVELFDHTLCQCSVGADRLDSVALLSFLADAMAGVRYLHSRDPPVIHRDLTLRNVLIKGQIAKLCDFGCARPRPTTNPEDLVGFLPDLTACPGNVLYMAPEALQNPPVYNESLDIFSFGVLATSVVTGVEPSADLHTSPRTIRQIVQRADGTSEETVTAITEVERRGVGEGIPDGHPLKPAIFRCLAVVAEERPKAEELHEILLDTVRVARGLSPPHLPNVPPAVVRHLDSISEQLTQQATAITQLSSRSEAMEEQLTAISQSQKTTEQEQTTTRHHIAAIHSEQSGNYQRMTNVNENQAVVQQQISSIRDEQITTSNRLDTLTQQLALTNDRTAQITEQLVSTNRQVTTSVMERLESFQGQISLVSEQLSRLSATTSQDEDTDGRRRPAVTAAPAAATQPNSARSAAGDAWDGPSAAAPASAYAALPRSVQANATRSNAVTVRTKGARPAVPCRPTFLPAGFSTTNSRSAPFSGVGRSFAAMFRRSSAAARPVSNNDVVLANTTAFRRSGAPLYARPNGNAAPPGIARPNGNAAPPGIARPNAGTRPTASLPAAAAAAASTATSGSASTSSTTLAYATVSRRSADDAPAAQTERRLLSPPLSTLTSEQIAHISNTRQWRTMGPAMERAGEYFRRKAIAHNGTLVIVTCSRFGMVASIERTQDLRTWHRMDLPSEYSKVSDPSLASHDGHLYMVGYKYTSFGRAPKILRHSEPQETAAATVDCAHPGHWEEVKDRPTLAGHRECVLHVSDDSISLIGGTRGIAGRWGSGGRRVSVCSLLNQQRESSDWHLKLIDSATLPQDCINASLVLCGNTLYLVGGYGGCFLKRSAGQWVSEQPPRDIDLHCSAACALSAHSMAIVRSTAPALCAVYHIASGQIRHLPVPTGGRFKPTSLALHDTTLVLCTDDCGDGGISTLDISV